jgi:outer membrane protein assembly factor BamA
MRPLLLLLVCAGVGACAAEASQPASLPAQQIQSVSIDGRALPLAALRAVLSTQPGATVDVARLEQDRVALQAELASRGHLAAHVDPASVVYGPTGGAFVTFQVTKGPVFKLRSVSVTGASERDTGVVTLTPGDEASADRIERARQALAENLARRGKPSHVSVALRADQAAGVVDVELTSVSLRPSH